MSEIYKIQVNDSEPIEVSQQVYEVSFYFNEMLKEKDKEIERLNNQLEDLEKLNNANYQSFIETNKIIIELEKWLRNEYSKYNGAIRIANVLDKIKELKGSDKE